MSYKKYVFFCTKCEYFLDNKMSRKKSIIVKYLAKFPDSYIGKSLLFTILKKSYEDCGDVFPLSFLKEYRVSSS